MQGGAASAALMADRYTDYREDVYEMAATISKPPPRKREPERGSASSTVSSVSKSDSVNSAGEAITLPTKSRRPRGSWCCVKRQTISGRHSGERLLCEVCDDWFYERDNVKGACRRRRGDSDRVLEACTCTPLLNCCLRRCTADADGRYSPAWQPNQVSKEKRCCRRTLFVLLGIVFPCIWCYKLCRVCHRQGKKDHCWGSKHIPVKVKVDPS